MQNKLKNKKLKILKDVVAWDAGNYFLHQRRWNFFSLFSLKKTKTCWYFNFLKKWWFNLERVDFANIYFHWIFHPNGKCIEEESAFMETVHRCYRFFSMWQPRKEWEIERLCKMDKDDHIRWHDKHHFRIISSLPMFLFCNQK